MTSALERFLSKNTIETCTELPVFHSTRAYYAKKILLDQSIKPRRCEVFKGEDLIYLFYGRPSYKMPDDQVISKYWQLPTVFIFESDVVNYKRAFPFDTGAFNQGLYPRFFDMMPRDEYAIDGNTNHPRKLISSFFVSAERYFRFAPRDKSQFIDDFDLKVTDEEIMALYELILHNHEKADDRRFSIELQTENEIILADGKCKAIIIPEEYLESEDIISQCAQMSIEVMSYPSFPLKQEMYYYAIYNAVYELYRQWGLAR